MPNMNERPPVPLPRAPGSTWPEIEWMRDLAYIAEDWFRNPTDLSWEEVWFLMDGIRRLTK